MNNNRQFVLCIKKEGSDDLKIRNIYEVLPDENAATDDYIRVIDQSGEDYLYPSNYFYPVELTESIR